MVDKWQKSLGWSAWRRGGTTSLKSEIRVAPKASGFEGFMAKVVKNYACPQTLNTQYYLSIIKIISIALFTDNCVKYTFSMNTGLFLSNWNGRPIPGLSIKTPLEENRVVFDSCVFVHIFASQMWGSWALHTLEERRDKLCMSNYIKGEVISAILGIIGEEKEEQAVRFWARMCHLASEKVEPLPVYPYVCPDPNDFKILGTALAARAGRLVTEDKDLLNIGNYQHIRIIPPSEYVTGIVCAPKKSPQVISEREHEVLWLSR